MKNRLKDPIYGIVEFSEIEKKIIDSPVMQRLREIKQLCLTNLVYIGANHTRFDHSVGTMYTASKMAQSIGLDVELSRISALIHDVGHVVYSHQGENVLKKFEGINHEKLGEELVLEHLSFLLDNYSKKELFDSNESRLCSFSIGADRLDYLKRDAFYTGVAYGVLEDDILVASLRKTKNKFSLKFSALEAAESLFVGRFMMFFAVYQHKTVRIASAMIENALYTAYEKGEISRENMLWDGDSVVLHNLCDKKSDLALRIKERMLYKRLVELDLNKDGFKIADELSKYGALYTTPPEITKDIDFFVLKDEGLIRVEEASPLVFSLKRTEKAKKNILIAVKNEEMKKFRKLVKSLIKQ